MICPQRLNFRSWLKRRFFPFLFKKRPRRTKRQPRKRPSKWVLFRCGSISSTFPLLGGKQAESAMSGNFKVWIGLLCQTPPQIQSNPTASNTPLLDLSSQLLGEGAIATAAMHFWRRDQHWEREGPMSASAGLLALGLVWSCCDFSIITFISHMRFISFIARCLLKNSWMKVFFSEKKLHTFSYG